MAQIPLIPIESSLFTAYRYDPATNRLTLRFQSGETYVYHDVPADKAAVFAENASPGRFYTEHIRGNFISSKVT